MSNEDIVTLIQKGVDVQGNLELLYTKNLPLIRIICKKYKNDNDIDDLMQVAFLGIVAAIPTYDRTKSKFFNYAEYYIYNEIREYRSEMEFPFVVSACIYDRIGKYQKAVAKFQQEHGRRPTNEQLRVMLNLSIQQIEELQRVIGQTVCIDAPVGDGRLMAEVIPDTREWFDNTDNDTDSSILWDMIEQKLDKKRFEVVRLRFVEGKTLQEIGDIYGVTKERARQICNRSLDLIAHDDRIAGVLAAEIEGENLYKGCGFGAFDRRWASSVEASVINRQRKKATLDNHIRHAKNRVDKKYGYIYH